MSVPTASKVMSLGVGMAAGATTVEVTVAVPEVNTMSLPVVLLGA